jgi:hypothetical protein
MNHFRKGNRTPAMSRIDVKVFSNINAATCNTETGQKNIVPEKVHERVKEKVQLEQIFYCNKLQISEAIGQCNQGSGIQ